MPHEPVTIGELAVALIKVPEIFEQVAPLVRKVALVHKSLGGGGGTLVTQIVKFAAVPIPEGFVLKLATRIK